ncbi:unnamed protein product [Meganyctiphanes norvegica]|uniref:C2H2-type domain-containing protein n=1 Tax=Meganyctiphanes norvegica TaxID=48144 RepID=A0AAV2PMI1_MEGNR
MAAGWSCENVVAEHRDLQLSNAMALDHRGEYLLLAGRRNLALICLDNPSVVKKRVSRTQQKYDVTAAEWNPVPAQGHTFAISSGERAEISACSDGAGITGVTSLKAHTRTITDLNWHKTEAHLLATCSIDTFVHIWDTRETRKPVASLSAIAGASQVKWNKLNPHILASGHDSDVRVWDQRKPSQPLHYIAAHLSKIHSLDWSPNHENQLVTSSNDCTVKFFDTTNPRRAENFINTLSPVWRARYTPFGEGVVTVVVPQLRRGENSLLLWSLTDMSSPVHTFVGHSDVVLEFEYRHKSTEPNDYQLVTWARDHSLRIWKIDQHLQKLCGRDTEEEALIGESSDAYSITSSELHQGELDIYAAVDDSSAESKGGTGSSDGATAEIASVLSVTPSTTDSEIIKELVGASASLTTKQTFSAQDEEFPSIAIEAGQDVVAPLASIPEVRTEDKDNPESGSSILLGSSAPIGSSVGAADSSSGIALGTSIGSTNSVSVGQPPMTLGQEFSLLNTSLDNSQSQVNSVEVLAAMKSVGVDGTTLASSNRYDPESTKKTAACSTLESMMEFSKISPDQHININYEEQEEIHKVISEMTSNVEEVTSNVEEVLSDTFKICKVPQKLHLRTVKVNRKPDIHHNLLKLTSVTEELMRGIANNINENQVTEKSETVLDINNSKYSVEITQIPDEMIEKNLHCKNFSNDFSNIKSVDIKKISGSMKLEADELVQCNENSFVTHKVESLNDDVWIEVGLSDLFDPNNIKDNSLISTEKIIKNYNDIQDIPPLKIIVSATNGARNNINTTIKQLSEAPTMIGEDLIASSQVDSVENLISHINEDNENTVVINLGVNLNSVDVEITNKIVTNNHKDEAVIHVINNNIFENIILGKGNQRGIDDFVNIDEEVPHNDAANVLTPTTITDQSKEMLGTSVESGIVITDGSVICQGVEIPSKIVYLSSINEIMNNSYEQVCATIAPQLFEKGVLVVGENLIFLGSEIFLVIVELYLGEDKEKHTRISINSPTEDLRSYQNNGVNFVMVYNAPIQGNSPVAFSAIDFGRAPVQGNSSVAFNTIEFGSGNGKPVSVRNAPRSDEPGMFQCDKCDKTYKYRSSLNSHKVTHNVEKLYKCDECDKAFHFSTPLIIHKRTHTDERPFKCESCSASFRARANLRFHQRLHTGERPIICRDCGLGYKDYTALKRHRIKIHSNYNVKCTHCSQILSADEHSAHMWKIHNVLYVDNMKIKCEKCNEILENREAYTVHMIEHERDDHANPSKMADYVHRCGICNMSLSSKPAMLSHIQIHAAVKKWKCRYCNLAFLYKYLLVAHVKDQHPDEPTWFCQYCDASFETSRNLNAHSCRMIHGDYTCPHCDWKTQLRHRFFRHIVKDHPEDKTPYYCEFCKKSFDEPNKLRYHQKREHPENFISLSLQRDLYKQKENGNSKEDGGMIDMSHIEWYIEENAIIYNIPNDLRNDQLFEKEVKFKCYYCDAKFPAKNAMTRHILRMHPDKQAYKCLPCNVFFSTSIQSKNHYRKYHRFSESEGRDPDRNQRYMKNRAKKLKNKLQENDSDIKKLYPFHCKFCTHSMVYREKRHLLTHYSKWHPNEEWDYFHNNKNNKVNNRMEKKQKLIFYECSFKDTCNITFDEERMIIDHVFNAHGVEKVEAKNYIKHKYVTDVVRRGRRPKNAVKETKSSSEDEVEDEFDENCFDPDLCEIKKEIDDDNFFEKDYRFSEEILSVLDVKKLLYKCKKCELSFSTKKEYRAHDLEYADKDCRIYLQENMKLQQINSEAEFHEENCIPKGEKARMKRLYSADSDCEIGNVNKHKRQCGKTQKLVIDSIESRDINIFNREISHDILLEEIKTVTDLVKIISVNANPDGTLSTSGIQEKNDVYCEDLECEVESLYVLAESFKNSKYKEANTEDKSSREFPVKVTVQKNC